MNINITLFLQIVNFFITYYILNRFFFKPIVDGLRKKKEKAQKLVAQVEIEKKGVALAQQERRDYLVTFQTHLKKDYAFIPERYHDQPIDFKYQDEPVKNPEKLTLEVVDLLVNKVPHVVSRS